jgi:hypothetical protein
MQQYKTVSTFLRPFAKLRQTTIRFATSVSWTDHVRNEEVLFTVKERRNILHEISKRKLTGLVRFCVETAFCNGLLKERKGRIEVTGRRGRRRRKLLDNLEERRGYSFEGGSSRSHYVESSFWKRRWTCRKTDG